MTLHRFAAAGTALFEVPVAGSAPIDITIAGGSVGVDYVPSLSAADDAAGTEKVVLDVAGTELQVAWAGDQSPSYLLARFAGGAGTGKLYTHHAAGEELSVMFHFGGQPSRPHFTVNGWGVLCTDAAVDVDPLPVDADVGPGMPGGWATFSLVRSDPVRFRPARRIVGIGDSITSEPNGSSGEGESWVRHCAAQVRRYAYAIALVKNGIKTLAVMSSDVAGSVVAQDFTDCVLLGGVNDLVRDRTLAQMKTDAQAIFDEVAAAGIRMVACTILPFKGYVDWTAAREVLRQQFNDWLRSMPSNLDAVVESADAVADPNDSQQLLASLGDGSGIHLSHAGAQVLGEAIASGAFADLLVSGGE